MITLLSEKTIEVPFKGSTVYVKFKVPTAIDAEEIISSKMKDSAIFKKFAIEISCKDVEELDGVFPSKLLEIPGTYPIMNKTALEILNSAIVSEEEKN